MNNTLTIQIPLIAEPTDPPMPPPSLETRITAECDIRYIAGYRLVAAFPVGYVVVLVFQKS